MLFLLFYTHFYFGKSKALERYYLANVIAFFRSFFPLESVKCDRTKDTVLRSYQQQLCYEMVYH
jgi:hypothetical protein